MDFVRKDECQRVVLSGCSGGGKTSLLNRFAQKGLTTFAEPGRQVIETRGIRPEDAPTEFAVACVEIALSQYQNAPPGLSFHDRSILDALCWFHRSKTPLPSRFRDLAQNCRYHAVVFLVPPWPEIFVNDHMRRHDLSDAIAEYDALLDWLPLMGYETCIVPQTDLSARAEWILAKLMENKR